jgi:S-formylglutathione hydrolase FrmB
MSVMRSSNGSIWAAVAIGLASGALSCTTSRTGAPLAFSVTVPAAVRADSMTGRVFLFIARDSTPEPRLAAGGASGSAPPPFYGLDVSALPPGQPAVLTDTTLGYPVSSLRTLPAGDYYVQALANVYTQFKRSDGHTMWAHMDQWEGQHFTRSPGNLVSAVQRVHLDPAAGYDVHLELTRVLPDLTPPADTKWVKHVKIQSDLLTKFWGHPMYLGAVVLLPDGYDAQPTRQYPVLYSQGHFGLNPPLGFSTDSTLEPARIAAATAGYHRESGYAFYKEWTSPGFPRMIAVTFQHPTPYYDDSYAVNSANNGPYGDAIMQELIPYIESHFHVIAKPYARVLSGGSTGGWESLALQLYHPDFFGGTWTAFPDPIDFRHWGLVDAYSDTNAFLVSGHVNILFSPVSEWNHPERPFMRANDGQPLLSQRQQSQLEDVLGSHGRSAEQLEIWEAVYGPVGADGYPEPLWDKRTGHINHDVAAYMRDHGYDLRAYLEQHWATLAPKLAGKIHIDVGDMDNFYLNLPVVDLQQMVDTIKAPRLAIDFHYGRPEMGHGWHHATNGEIIREMAASIAAHGPTGAVATANVGR